MQFIFTVLQFVNKYEAYLYSYTDKMPKPDLNGSFITG